MTLCKSLKVSCSTIYIVNISYIMHGNYSSNFCMAIFEVLKISMF